LFLLEVLPLVEGLLLLLLGWVCLHLHHHCHHHHERLVVPVVVVGPAGPVCCLQLM